MMLIDSHQRSQATDPSRSFIVQAPAGSGKTEILTQRYLRLLGRVTAPEQIIALTFTRKAASEMRERIVIALQDAARGKEAASPHQQMTLSYAKEALEASKQHSWNILEQPNRLKIITIDSLCQSINQSIPLLDKQIAYSNITDQPELYYTMASRECIRHALEEPEYQQAIKTLLLHVDNRQDRLMSLFTSLLAQRDQWLRPLFIAKAQDKATLEQGLQYIEQHELNRFKQSLPAVLASELVRLARTMACIENNPQSPRYPLREWYDFQNTNQPMATALSKLIFTGELNFRTAFDHHVGLKRGECTDQEYEDMKSASKQLLAQLADYPGFQDALIQVSELPKPHYDQEQWDMLQALFILLPLLVGHLHVLLSDHNEVDFVSISQQAIAALGDGDNPTDLALYLDHAIHHLLVDEFQDTSITQFDLLSKLVQGWEPGDGKTLFLVGDPMQSIYRFRQAEVGLFFKAKAQGIGPVQLHSLELSCNFRSNAHIVEWVNQQFSYIFPAQVDIESGAVMFHSSAAIHPGHAESEIKAFQYQSKQEEAAHLIELVQLELDRNPQQSIAILVRSRSHLLYIIRLLRQHHIPYQGTDIDLLSNLPHIRDVYSLTMALLMPANRLHWLAMLRSPFCGLSLKDLHCIAQFNKKKSIYYALVYRDDIKNLSEEGRQRLHYFFQVIQKALANRYQSRLSAWIISTLNDLQVDKILDPSQGNDLSQFWMLVDKFEEDGRLPDIKGFNQAIQALYSQQGTPARLQIMTIHKSKGLEFDTVFLPSIGSKPNLGDKPMMRWLKLPSQQQKEILLISPMKAAHHERCALYDYLTQLDEEKAGYETQRLLYVAVTRAKERLYLMNSSSQSAKGSFYSFLKQQEFIPMDLKESTEAVGHALPKLSRLPLTHYEQQHILSIPTQAVPSSLNSGIPRIIGIVTHLLLQTMCEHHLNSMEELPWALATNELKRYGFNPLMQEEAITSMQEQIQRFLNDPVGLWIISPHLHEQNEYELLVSHQQQVVTRIIDRIFEDQGKLWIIDFKTGKEDDRTQQKYQQQLNDYAQHLATRTELPIHCGLYYLPTNHWATWHYVPSFIPSQR